MINFKKNIILMIYVKFQLYYFQILLMKVENNQIILMNFKDYLIINNKIKL